MTPDPNKPKPLFYEFGPFRINVSERILLSRGEVVPLTLKVFETLLILVERRGHVVGKGELMQALWPDSFVEENTLSQNISLLRKALGGGASGQPYIVTMAKRGYSFVADVQEVCGDAPTRPNVQPAAGVTVEGPPSPPLRQPARRWRARTAFSRSRWKGAALTACVLGATASAFFLWGWGGRGRDNPVPATIAVLPFKVRGAANEADLLGLGMADALSLKLSSLSRPAVLPSSSVFKYAGRDGDALQIGRELGVDAVLDGTVHRAGERLQVTARLINPGDGTTIWAGQFDESSPDIFTLQNSISEQIAQALARRVGAPGEHPTSKQPTRDAEAYQLYLVGAHLRHQMTADALSKAAEQFQLAADRDPNFALAYAGLADAYSLIAALRYPALDAPEAWEKARAAALRAVELDGQTAEAYTVLAWYETHVTRDYEQARRLHLRALALKPNHAVGHARYAGLLLLAGGPLDEAVARLRQAQTLNPTSVEANMVLAYVLELARRHDEAIHYSRRALDIDPENLYAQEVLGFAYAHSRRCDEAVAVFQGLKRHETRPALYLEGTAYALAFNGRKGEAETALAELTERVARRERVEPYNMAAAHAAMGRKEEAFGWLEQVRELSPEFLAHSRTLDPIRHELRFAEFVRARRERASGGTASPRLPDRR
ncbi:MAG TPA: winged helix-turn-helix domain-containing protein [Pyrinomonadaceae bacterium]